MKYLVCSDIHGSKLYVDQLLKNYNDSFDKIIILGDVLYHGPRNDIPEGYAPKEVIKTLNPLKEKIVCVQGNCDAEVDQMVLEFEIKKNYRFSLGTKNFYCEHGHHIDFDHLKNYEADVILYGHFHIPEIKEKDGIILANPGSTTIVKNGLGHTFIILDEKEIKLLSLDGTLINSKNI